MNDSTAGDPPAHTVTVLDVIENFFGDTPTRAAVFALSRTDIEQLGDLLLHSSDVSAVTPAPAGLTYPGGWLAGNWAQQLLRGDLNLALLYYPRLLVHDPLADFFFRDWDAIPPTRVLQAANGGSAITTGPGLWAKAAAYESMKDDLQAVRGYLTAMIEYLLELAPLLRSEVLVARAQWPTILARKQMLLASVRHDVRAKEMQEVAVPASNSSDPLPTWDTIRGLNVTPTGGFRRSDEPWRWQNEYFYLAKTLAVADAAGATYAPGSESELALLRAKSTQLKVKIDARQPLELLREVARVLLPDLQLDAKTAVALRESEDAFDDWRRQLRSLARAGASSGPEDHLRERVEDELIPSVRRVEAAVSRSTALKKALKEQRAATVITGGVNLAATSMTGASPLVVGGVAAVGGVLQWLWKAYRPASLGGADQILASLLRHRGPQDD